jgi:signal transduction histidine kinase
MSVNGTSLAIAGLVLLAGGLAVFFWKDIRQRRLEHLLEALFAMRVGQDVGQILSETLDQLRGILEARSVMFFFYESGEEQLYRWIAAPGGGMQTMSELSPMENPRWMDFTAPIHVETLGPSHPIAERLGVKAIVSVGGMARGNSARLLVIEPLHELNAALLAALRRLNDMLFSLAEKVFLLRRVHLRAIDEERERIAQDFHDGPLQTFFSFDVHLQFIRQILETDPEQAAKELELLQTMAREQGRELRELIMEMRPVDVESASLISVLRHAVEGSQKSGGIQVRLIADDTFLEVPRRICRQTYQMLREALTNARKHARAQHVVVALEEGPDYFVLTIDDDGTGFKFAGTFTLEQMDEQRIGPVSIKQRARQLEAELTLESNPGQGSRLRIRVPVPPAPPRIAELSE